MTTRLHPSVEAMTFAGVRVICSPFLPRAPRIGVKQIYLKDGTPLLSPTFIEQENRWWRERFGEVDQAYRTPDGVFVPPAMYQELRRRMVDAVEADILNGFGAGANVANTANSVNTANTPGGSTLTYEKVRDSYLRHQAGLLRRKAFSLYDWGPSA